MRVAIAGLGTVGAEVARQIIAGSKDNLYQGVELVAVSARHKNKDRGIALGKIDFYDNPVELAKREDVDCVIELIGGEGDPALTLIKEAIANGKSVITANKALLAHHGMNLASMAEKKGVVLAAEASVGGGIPCLKLIREGLVANRISRIAGILNGTSNYILSEMSESGRDFASVLKEAQDLGYAEADPSFDIDGIDSAHKLVLLAALGFGIAPDLKQVSTRGIRSLSSIDIAMAATLGYAVKLLGIAELVDDKVSLSVEPVMVEEHSMLAKVNGALNAVSVTAEPVGMITAIGEGAGAGATASAVLADLMDVKAGLNLPFFGRPAKSMTTQKHNENLGQAMRFYIRLEAYDRPGVLADITTVFSKHKISVESLLQQGRSAEGEAGVVPVVLITHEVGRKEIALALAEIGKLKSVAEEPQLMAIVDGADDR